MNVPPVILHFRDVALPSAGKDWPERTETREAVCNSQIDTLNGSVVFTGATVAVQLLQEEPVEEEAPQPPGSGILYYSTNYAEVPYAYGFYKHVKMLADTTIYEAHRAYLEMKKYIGDLEASKRPMMQMVASGSGGVLLCHLMELIAKEGWVMDDVFVFRSKWVQKTLAPAAVARSLVDFGSVKSIVLIDPCLPVIVWPEHYTEPRFGPSLYITSDFRLSKWFPNTLVIKSVGRTDSLRDSNGEDAVVNISGPNVDVLEDTIEDLAPYLRNDLTSESRSELRGAYHLIGDVFSDGTKEAVKRLKKSKTHYRKTDPKGSAEATGMQQNQTKPKGFLSGIGSLSKPNRRR